MYRWEEERKSAGERRSLKIVFGTSLSSKLVQRMVDMLLLELLSGSIGLIPAFWDPHAGERKDVDLDRLVVEDVVVVVAVGMMVRKPRSGPNTHWCW